MSQEPHVSPANPQRRRRFRTRSKSNQNPNQISKLGATVLMLMALMLVIFGCIFAIRLFE